MAVVGRWKSQKLGEGWRGSLSLTRGERVWARRRQSQRGKCTPRGASRAVSAQLCPMEDIVVAEDGKQGIESNSQVTNTIL